MACVPNRCCTFIHNIVDNTSIADTLFVRFQGSPYMYIDSRGPVIHRTHSINQQGFFRWYNNDDLKRLMLAAIVIATTRALYTTRLAIVAIISGLRSTNRILEIHLRIDISNSSVRYGFVGNVDTGSGRSLHWLIRDHWSGIGTGQENSDEYKKQGILHVVLRGSKVWELMIIFVYWRMIAVLYWLCASSYLPCLPINFKRT